MIHTALAHIIDLVAGMLRTPTQINLFLMCKIILIKSVQGTKHITFDKHTGTCGPKNLYGVIVLPLVLFYGLKDSSPAKGVSQHIDKPASGTGILKVIPLFQVQYFGLY